MTNSKEEHIQRRIENLLRDNLSKSNSKDEIINLLSSNHRDTYQKIEIILAEMQVQVS